MCGLVSIFAYSSGAPAVDRDELLRIRDHMTMRGPDGFGAWYSADGRVGLGHRRLAIIDRTESGSQPMFTADERFGIVFNGEIYNYRKLRSDLESRGFRFRSDSDTEVLLHLYAEKGVEMVHDLRGMYAFAIWDEEKQGLFIARDPFGIKPLYYANDGRSIRVASQVKALLAGGRIDTRPEPAGHVGFFVWGYVPDPYTMYKGIRSLPAGSWLWVSSRQSPARSSATAASTVRNSLGHPHEFCRLHDEFSQTKRSKGGTIGLDRTAELRDGLLDSVRHHLVADVPVGVFLSSGRDSCTLAALAAELKQDPLHTVTLGFHEYKNTPLDEVPLAELVSRHLRSKHQTYWITHNDFADKMARFLECMDQPSIDGLNSYMVSEVMARSGHKAAISGLGGDEMFQGYPSFAQIPAMLKGVGGLSRIPGLGRSFRLLFAPVLKQFTSPKYAGLLEYGGTWGGAYLLRRGLFMPWELPDLLDGDLVREGWAELQTLSRLNQAVLGICNSKSRVSAMEMEWYMRSQLLRDTDWASMAHSLEVRVPFVDLELLRAVIRRSGYDRSPNKQEMASTPARPLPDAILNRPKTGFVVPVQEWFGNEQNKFRGLRGWAMKVYGSMNS